MILAPIWKKRYTHSIRLRGASRMGQFLNNKEPYDKYKTVMNGTFFVDKTEILKELIPALQQENSYGKYDSSFF